MRKLKNDDRGVTLVEIIVSIAILAIIVLPFLNAFVTATKTNVKAKNEMNATHLATNIMEGIEKNSMKTLAYQFNYPSEYFDVADGFNISDGSSACELLKKSDKFDNVKRLEDISAEIVNKDDVITSCIHKTDAKAKIGDASLWNFRESDAHKYYFYMSGVQSGTKKYNALVTVDAKSDAESDNKVRKYNMDEVADMSAMDANFDCMSADKYSATNIISAFNNMNPGFSVQQSDIKRTIKIDIEKSGAASNKATKVTVSYSYSIKNGVKKTFPDPNSALKDDYTMVIYDNSSDTVNHNLRNVYLFYNPWYTSTGNTWDTANDVIIVNNKDKVDCTVNIVKQKTISDQSELSTKESTYKAYVRVSEPGNRTGHAYTHIATNLNVNMGAPDNPLQPGQAIYGFNNNVIQNDVKKIVDIKNLTKSKASERLYDVKVDIYESKASLDDIFKDKDPVVTMTGSMGY
ncbi:prepilin-type N-terminal cleavage/methylation domain-containing protein [Agathobacter rectalis]|uniref:Prepilin-type N-terminal cleavage/methylation domain-containing protein n=1 Tax=Agathobacter rectalis TaxID=39491 RepID=A0A414IR76_9FIRM|nr:prepilin-type N-terminal cleavage/methylation domain-containing protein [Agathobacter rectalis]RGT08525.1 prepilin-type N-terminal cleavage/methylation domain-containing protein [Agathobacter rectalis]RGT16599.1 prepilin-type N-terminal cleavage/methylation domain-containing protein [Agathobacter rectalis]RHE30951.1 prepilin-type N-terminal cleavage/methylation domain-containing protein [Agathobacter rectalis]